MKFVSKLALAAALTLGASALGAAPAAAQKKDQQGPDLKLSEAFRKVAAPADAAVRAKDWATAEPAIVASEAAAKNEDEKFFAAQMRLQLELARNNEPGMIAAMSVLVNNPKTPAQNVTVFNTQLNLLNGYAAAKAKKYPEAIQYLTKARELGSTEPDIAVTLANAYSATGKDAEAVAEVDRSIKASKAAGRKPPIDWYRFAIPRVNKMGDRAAMADWLTRYIQDYPTVPNWRWAIQVFAQGQTAGVSEKVERIDLYRLMRSTNSLADRGDYGNYSFAVQQAGLPWEAVAVIDEGRKNGKIPAGDSDVQRTYQASVAGVKAEGSLDALAKAAKTGTAASQTADAYLASGNYARALELYDQALAKGGVNADEVNLHRGIALKNLGRTAFQQVKGGYANLATLWQASIDFPPLAA
jgi:tetratricopeptide (TPR) repeat protein